MAARTPGGFLSSPGFHAAIFFFFHCLKNHSTLCRFLPWYSSFYLWSLLDHYILIQRIPASSGYQASSVKLFNRLQWPPFYEESKIAKCCLAYKRIKGEVPLYTENSLILNSQHHNRATRYSNTNFICPRFNRMTEGGRPFAVTTC